MESDNIFYGIITIRRKVQLYDKNDSNKVYNKKTVLQKPANNIKYMVRVIPFPFLLRDFGLIHLKWLNSITRIRLDSEL